MRSKNVINVLGVLFDSKIQCSLQVAQAVNKSKRALHAIKLVSKYLTKIEIKQILTSNFYSVLYYNCEVWMMQTLSPILKRHLLSASANALKLLNNVSDLRMSHEQIHRLQKRAMPMDMMKYRLSIQLYKIYNRHIDNDDWLDMNVQQNFNARSSFVKINDYSNLKIGKNIMTNRLGILNNQIDYDWLNLSLTSFKLRCKALFLTNQ